MKTDQLTYEQWKKLYPEAIQLEKCEVCDGRGEIECESCGTIHECEYCGGTGYEDLSLAEYTWLKRIEFKKLEWYLKHVEHYRRARKNG